MTVSLVSAVITSNYIFALSFRSQWLRSTSLSSPNGDTTHRSNLIDFRVHAHKHTHIHSKWTEYCEYVSSIQIACPAIADVCASCSMSCIIYSTWTEINMNCVCVYCFAIGILSLWALHTRHFVRDANFLDTFTNKVQVDGDGHSILWLRLINIIVKLRVQSNSLHFNVELISNNFRIILFWLFIFNSHEIDANSWIKYHMVRTKSRNTNERFEWTSRYAFGMH